MSQRFIARITTVVIVTAIAVSSAQQSVKADYRIQKTQAEAPVRHEHGQGRSASAVAGEIARIREQWSRDLHDKRLEEITALYAPDAVFLAGDIGRVTGRPAVRELCRNVMAAVTSNLTWHSVTVESSGNLAYDSGEYDETLVPMAGGTPQQSKGSYLIVFRRGRDGKWLIVEQVWTEVKPATH
ncbi:MAG TPA: DUF4440 domain-containing protein [Verrucomicrobiae bacterium]|jgi:ketosteroid isomerase-like protein|nr:DUF4440 domain-containing protein [Verrucomicrobiae bacterium]